MKKLLLLFLTLILIGLVGCGEARTKVNTGMEQMVASKIVSISITNDMDGVFKLTDSLSIVSFVKSITTAEYSTGQLDIGSSDYGIVLEMVDGSSERLSFWIKGDNTGLMIKSGQDGHYQLLDVYKKELQELFANETEMIEASTVDDLIMGDKHYINAWELAVVDPTKLIEIGKVELASRLSKGSSIFEIEGYSERSVVAVREESDEVRMVQNINGFSIYVWNEGSGQPSHYPNMQESEVQQIQVYKGTKLIRELIAEDVTTFLKLMKQTGPNNEFQFDRAPQYTVVYVTNGALGNNYGILEKDGEFGLAHIESKLPVEIAQYFQ